VTNYIRGLQEKSIKMPLKLSEISWRQILTSKLEIAMLPVSDYVDLLVRRAMRQQSCRVEGRASRNFAAERT
jgi:hypothetical protein